MKAKNVFKAILSIIVSLGIVVAILYVITIGFKNPFKSTKRLEGKELATLYNGENDDLLRDMAKEGVYIDDYSQMFSNYCDELAAEDSDIEGMTKYDKLLMGLGTEDGSDTDHDGLTDKEEIELYGSDPLKASTADDLYLDGYKAENGMELNKKCDYEGDFEYKFPENISSNVTLEPKKATDYYAAVSEITVDKPEDFSLNGTNFTVYKCYNVSNFYGNVSIDVSDIISDNHIFAEDIIIYKGGIGEDFHSCKTKLDGNIITVNDDTDNDSYILYVGNKNDSTDLKKMMKTGMQIILTDDYIEPYGLAKYSEVGLLFLHQNPTIYLVDTKNEALNEYVKNKFLTIIDDNIFTRNFKEEIATGVLSEDDIFVYESRAEIELRYDALKSRLPKLEITEEDAEPAGFSPQLIYGYYPYSTISNYKLKGEEKFDVRDREHFDIVEDTLPFGNFGTDYHPAGMCAGIAELTTEVYNTKGIPADGSSGFGSFLIDEVINYDLSTDPENATLLDYGLNDYKTATWVEEHSTISGKGEVGENLRNIDYSTLTDGERQFVNYIVCKWAQVNQLITAKTSYMTPEKGKYPMDRINHLKSILDENKIVTANLLIAQPVTDKLKYSAGHTVNIYGYHDNANGTISLYVYDNNYPNQDGLSILIEPIYTDDGREYFDYEYITPHYRLTSKDTEMYSFSMNDESFTLIN